MKDQILAGLQDCSNTLLELKFYKEDKEVINGVVSDIGNIRDRIEDELMNEAEEKTIDDFDDEDIREEYFSRGLDERDPDNESAVDQWKDDLWPKIKEKFTLAQLEDLVETGDIKYEENKIIAELEDKAFLLQCKLDETEDKLHELIYSLR